MGISRRNGAAPTIRPQEITKTAKKTNKAKKSKQVARIHSLHIESKVDQIYAEIIAGKYEAAIETSKILLTALPKASTYRVGVIINMGLVYLQMGQFKLAYQTFTEALALKPDDPFLLYNYAIASRNTTCYGRALQNLERAMELGVPPEIERSLKQELKAVRKLVEQAMKMRDKNFTLDQLIEQEDVNQHALQLFAEGKYAEAEIALKRS